MAHITTIPPEEAEGRLAEIYREVAGRRGSVANVHQIHSLMPETMRSHLQYYMDVMYGKGPLSRAEREAVAVAVSAANECRYCVSHHSDALNKYLKDEEATRLIATDLEASPLTEAQKALCRFAIKLTKTPGAMGKDDVKTLRDAGWDDSAILHVNQVTSYFNFVNRMVLGLGVAEEEEELEYKY